MDPEGFGCNKLTAQNQCIQLQKFDDDSAFKVHLLGFPSCIIYYQPCLRTSEGKSPVLLVHIFPRFDNLILGMCFSISHSIQKNWEALAIQSIHMYSHIPYMITHFGIRLLLGVIHIYIFTFIFTYIYICTYMYIFS